jgi:sporulation protein YlmC with PRC-barrel domain
MKKLTWLALATAVAFTANPAFADHHEEKKTSSTGSAKEGEFVRGYHASDAKKPGLSGIEKITRSKDLIGMDVKNSRGEKVGNIEDVALDLETGKISYLALAAGGILGVQDRLFAVPADRFKRSETDRKVLVLDVDKNALRQMSGFVKNNWPDKADDSIMEKARLKDDVREPAGADIDVKKRSGKTEIEVDTDRKLDTKEVDVDVETKRRSDRVLDKD